MTKILIALTLVGFWLFLPIGFIYFGVAGFEDVSFRQLESQNPINFLASMFFYTFPSINWFFGRLLNLLQVLTAVMVWAIIKNP